MSDRPQKFTGFFRIEQMGEGNQDGPLVFPKFELEAVVLLQAGIGHIVAPFVHGETDFRGFADRDDHESFGADGPEDIGVGFAEGALGHVGFDEGAAGAEQGLRGKPLIDIAIKIDVQRILPVFRQVVEQQVHGKMGAAAHQRGNDDGRTGSGGDGPGRADESRAVVGENTGGDALQPVDGEPTFRFDAPPFQGHRPEIPRACPRRNGHRGEGRDGRSF